MKSGASPTREQAVCYIARRRASNGLMTKSREPANAGGHFARARAYTPRLHAYIQREKERRG